MTLAEQVARARAEKVPAGWLTAQQMAAKENYGTACGGFHYILRAACAEGLVEKRLFRIYSGNAVRAVAHYRRVR